jgi:hypothetical protein
MSFPVVLEVGIGMILIYYLLSLIVSAVTSKINEYLDLRAESLEKVLREALSSPDTEGETLYDKVMADPLIQNLAPKKLKMWSGEMHQHLRVNKIPTDKLALALFNQFFPQKDETGADDSRQVLERMRQLIDGDQTLLRDDHKTVLINAIDTAEGKLDTARKNVESWFDDTMSRAGDIYRQYARRVAILVALIVVVAVDVDSVAVARTLYTQPTARSAAVAAVEQYATTTDENGDQPDADAVSEYINTLDELQLPVMWSNIPDRADNDLFQEWAWKIFGWVIIWFAVSQGSSFWYDILKKVRSIPTGSAPTDAGASG